MKINRMDNPFPVVFIDDFIPSPSLVRAAAESYDEVEDWVKYGGEDVGQVQWCNRLGRENITSTALILWIIWLHTLTRIKYLVLQITHFLI